MDEPHATPLGSYLRSLREAKGTSLEEMARSTRVSTRHLSALESELLSELPAPVFVKGFIRAYCHSLGERADEALDRYRDLIEQRLTDEPRARPVRRAPSFQTGQVLVSLALLVVLGGGLLAFNVIFKRAPKPPVEPVVTVAPTPSPEPPGPRAPGSPSAPGGTGSDAAQRLLVKAVEATWIRVQTDDGRIAEELLRPGATREWTSGKRFLLTVGNAGGIELELNGQRLPPLGASGAVIYRLELPQQESASGS